MIVLYYIIINLCKDRRSNSRCFTIKNY